MLFWKIAGHQLSKEENEAIDQTLRVTHRNTAVIPPRGSEEQEEYAEAFRFTGTINHVSVDLSGELIQDSEADLKIAMARP